MSINRSKETGDTLIEVLMSISVMAVVVVGIFSLMNQGVSQMYDSMERSEVRMLIDQQIESLTYARDQFLIQAAGQTPTTTEDQAAATEWAKIRDNAQVGSLSSTPGLNDCTNTTDAFSIQRSGSGIQVNSTVTAVAPNFPGPGSGLWIQKIRNASVPVPYDDFYVRACWYPTGSTKMQVLSTVVRLYDK